MRQLELKEKQFKTNVESENQKSHSKLNKSVEKALQ